MAYNVSEHVQRLFSNKPDGTWHPLCEVHAGGPAWRWPEAGCLSRPYPSRINNQRYKLHEPDLLPNFFSYLKGLKMKIPYKQRRFVFCQQTWRMPLAAHDFLVKARRLFHCFRTNYTAHAFGSPNSSFSSKMCVLHSEGVAHDQRRTRSLLFFQRPKQIPT